MSRRYITILQLFDVLPGPRHVAFTSHKVQRKRHDISEKAVALVNDALTSSWSPHNTV